MLILCVSLKETSINDFFEWVIYSSDPIQSLCWLCIYELQINGIFRAPELFVSALLCFILQSWTTCTQPPPHPYPTSHPTPTPFSRLSLHLADHKPHRSRLHYLSQCWLRIVSPYDITSPQWVHIPVWFRYQMPRNVWGEIMPLEVWDQSVISCQTSYNGCYQVFMLLFKWNSVCEKGPNEFGSV